MSDRPQKGDPIVFFDIESLPAELNDPLWTHLSESMNPKNETLPEFEARKEEVRRLTSLTPVLGRTWMIGAAFRADEPAIFAGNGSPEAEIEVLKSFQDYLSKYEGSWLIGFNILGFDIPFLQVRALKHRLPGLAQTLGRFKTKPWESRVLDLSKIWPRTSNDRTFWEKGLQGVGKMDTICRLLGIPAQEGVMGKDIYQAYLNDDLQGSISHLREDVIQTRELYKILQHIV